MGFGIWNEKSIWLEIFVHRIVYRESRIEKEEEEEHVETGLILPRSG